MADDAAQIAVLKAILEEREKAIEKALEAADRAIDKAETTVTSRLEGFPQIYMLRGEADVTIKALESRVDELREKALDKDYYYREHSSLKDSLEKDTDALSDRLGRLETLGARVAGGLAVVGVIGIANLVKLWAG
jgi:chromosome segregation ATPase